AKPVFHRMTSVLVELDGFGLYAGAIVRMDTVAPEISILEVFRRLVSEDIFDVLADDSWRKITGCPVAVDDGGGRRKKPEHASPPQNPNLSELLSRQCDILRAD